MTIQAQQLDGGEWVFTDGGRRLGTLPQTFDEQAIGTVLQLLAAAHQPATSPAAPDASAQQIEWLRAENARLAKALETMMETWDGDTSAD